MKSETNGNRAQRESRWQLGQTDMTVKDRVVHPTQLNNGSRLASGSGPSRSHSVAPPATALNNAEESYHSRSAIEQCVQSELQRYLEILNDEDPVNLYRMIIRQAEFAVIDTVMRECRGNQTRASEWLGISRGNLRTKLASMKKS